MAVTSTPIYPQLIRNSIATIAAADTTTPKLLIQADGNGTKIEQILITNGDNTARTMTLYYYINSTSYVLATFTLPANAGSSVTVSPYDAMGPTTTFGSTLHKDASGNPYLYIAEFSFLYLSVGTTVTNTMNILVIGESF